MAGFHSPQIASPAIMNECLSLPFKPGARISHGYLGVFPALPDRGQPASNLLSGCREDGKRTCPGAWETAWVLAGMSCLGAAMARRQAPERAVVWCL